MPMRDPLSICRSRRGKARRSRPSNHTSPETTALGSRPTIAWVSTLLPEPDSPAMPKSSPASTENETSCKAWTVPSSVGMLTLRCRTSRTGKRSDPSCRRRWARAPRASPNVGNRSLALQPDIRPIALHAERIRLEVLDGFTVIEHNLVGDERNHRRIGHHQFVHLPPELADLL